MSDTTHHHSPLTAAIYLITGLITGFFGWIGWTDMQEWMKFVSLLISSCAGIMAIRYYYIVSKKK